MIPRNVISALTEGFLEPIHANILFLELTEWFPLVAIQRSGIDYLVADRDMCDLYIEIIYLTRICTYRLKAMATYCVKGEKGG
jgi:hypothetical protein